MDKIRVFPEHNYLSIMNSDGKSYRFQIEDDKPITELDYPEFLDVSITSFCEGKCQWCYQDSTVNGEHATNIVEKVTTLFGRMTSNERPFQLAIGGGEPTTHPDFIPFLKAVKELGIVPNYTTNGMNLTDEIIQATKDYCGGVAVSFHPHLKQYWTSAVELLSAASITNLNAHIIISDKDSIDFFLNCYKNYNDIIKYFVLLPYTAQGRAEAKLIDFDYLTEVLNNIPDISKIAFGAGFYDYLQDKNWGARLYEPEIMSGYLMMSNMKVYKSSFNLTEKEVGDKYEF